MSAPAPSAPPPAWPGYAVRAGSYHAPGVRHTSHRRLLLILGAGLAVLVVAVIASAFAVIVAALQQAVDAGALHVDDPETTTRLLLGALTRGAMLIASSSDPVQTRDAVSRSMRALLNGLRPSD